MCTGGSYTEMHKGAGMTFSRGDSTTNQQRFPKVLLLLKPLAWPCYRQMRCKNLPVIRGAGSLNGIGEMNGVGRR